MRCVSKKKALTAKGKLKPGFTYGSMACIVPAGSKAGKGGSGRCKFGRVQKGKNTGKCRTRPLPDFSKFGTGRSKKGSSYRESADSASRALARAFATGRAALARRQSADSASRALARAFATGRAALARRQSNRSRRDSRGRFV